MIVQPNSAQMLIEEVERLRALLCHPNVVKHVPAIEDYGNNRCPICLKPLEYVNKLINGQNAMQGGPMGCGDCGWTEPSLTEDEKDWNRAIRKLLGPSQLVRCVLLSDHICAKYKPGEDPGFPEQVLRIIADNFIKNKRPVTVTAGRDLDNAIGTVVALSANRFNGHACLFADVHLDKPLPSDQLISCSITISKWPCREPLSFPDGTGGRKTLIREEPCLYGAYCCLAGDHLFPEARKYGLRPVEE